ncbi:hypothetical protein GHT09_015195 [Marmota monax]|uniref:Uncharacterized protein n=1 Tax=Marmota monax TaxID=9995 RepID=A0A834PRB9_MARMO|nr:hypothetical protein GHT09_015195 [Marmota monax]
MSVERSCDLPSAKSSPEKRCPDMHRGPGRHCPAAGLPRGADSRQGRSTACGVDREGGAGGGGPGPGIPPARKRAGGNPGAERLALGARSAWSPGIGARGGGKFSAERAGLRNPKYSLHRLLQRTEG